MRIKRKEKTLCAITPHVNSSLTVPLCANHQNQDLWLCFRCWGEWFDVRVPLQHFQFISTCSVSEHKRHEQAISLLTREQRFHINLCLTAFSSILSFTCKHLTPDTLIALNWPRHYAHIRVKLAPDDTEIIFWMTWIWLLPRSSVSHGNQRKGLWFAFHCQNKVKITTLGDIADGWGERMTQIKWKERKIKVISFGAAPYNAKLLYLEANLFKDFSFTGNFTSCSRLRLLKLHIIYAIFLFDTTLKAQNRNIKHI